MPELELVVPCYNESLSLGDLVRQVVEAASQHKMTPESFQLVLVDNGSTDNTQEVITQLKNSHLAPWFRCVQVVDNQGVGFGVMSGLNATTAPYTGWIHADLQNDPKDVFRALNILKACDIPEKTLVKGVRVGRNIFQYLQSRIFDATAFFLLGTRIKELGAMPKIFHRQLLTALNSPPKHSAFDLYVLYKAQMSGYTIRSLEVTLLPRKYGDSHWAKGLLSRYKALIFMGAYMLEIRKNISQ